MHRSVLAVGLLLFSVLAHAGTGVERPQHPVKGRDKKLTGSYVLPYLREVGKVDPLWRTEIPLVDERRSQRPPREHMAELRTWAKTHPGDREQVAWYLRMFRKLDPYVKHREQRALAEQSHPPDELALEYRLPHLGPGEHQLPAGLADPLHCYTKNGVVFYVHGDDMTKKAPHVHIAELEAWSLRHPAGKTHPGAIFLNGASSATEFASFAEDQRDPQRPYMRPNTGGWGALIKQRDVTVTTHSGKTLTLASLGQVINFDNGPGVLPPRYAQLIVGLLYSSSLQAVRTTVAGVHDLELQAQH